MTKTKTVWCDECGCPAKANPEGDGFDCKNCGHRNVFPPVLECPVCGARVEAEEANCPSCNVNLGEPEEVEEDENIDDDELDCRYG